MKNLIILVVFCSATVIIAVHRDEQKYHESVYKQHEKEHDEDDEGPPGYHQQAKTIHHQLEMKLDAIIEKLDEIVKASERLCQEPKATPNQTTIAPTEPNITEPASTESLKLASHGI